MSPVARYRESPARFARPVAAAAAALALGFAVAACDDNSGKTGSSQTPPDRQQTQQTTPPSPPQTTPSAPRTAPDAAQPPKTAPGAAPSIARLIGTWTITESKGGPADTAKTDRAETTTYRFEEGGRVTVAGAKQCAYTMQETELKVDCDGQITAGKIEFHEDGKTMIWTVGANHTVTLKKR